MPVNSTHARYDEFLPQWLILRDVVAGEKAVKEAGEKYIPRLELQSSSEYDAYVNRGYFYNATARSVDGYLGIIFRKQPVFQLGPKAQAFTSALSEIENDVDLAGTSLSSYAKKVVEEVLVVGRCGSLVDWNDVIDKRAYLCLYHAENILNWQTIRVGGMYGGEVRYSLIALQEKQERPNPADPFVPIEVDVIRVLRLVPSGDSFVYQVEIWEQVPSKTNKKKVEWEITKSFTPLRRGKPLGRIPFVFHGPSSSSPEPQKSPIQDIVNVNLDHFRLSTDYRHGMHFTALPTAWVSGFDKATELRIGSAVAWVSDQVGAAAGFLEFKGQGLMTFERALDRAERLLGVLGSRLLESQKRVSESAEALSIRQSGEFSVIQDIGLSVSDSIDELLHWVYWWHSTEVSPDDVTPEHAVFKLNSDFEANLLSAKEILAMVYAWQSSAISRDTLHYNLKQGEVLPPGRTTEQEAALILAFPAPPPPGPLPQLSGSGN